MLSNIYEAKYGGPLKKDVYIMNATIKLRYRSLHIQDTELMQIKVTVLHAEGHMYGLMIEELIILMTPEISRWKSNILWFTTETQVKKLT